MSGDDITVAESLRTPVELAAALDQALSLIRSGTAVTGAVEEIESVADDLRLTNLPESDVTAPKFTIPGGATVTVAHLIRAAVDLRSENEENPEYDRALVELISDVIGIDSDHRSAIEFIVLGSPR